MHCPGLVHVYVSQIKSNTCLVIQSDDDDDDDGNDEDEEEDGEKKGKGVYKAPKLAPVHYSESLLSTAAFCRCGVCQLTTYYLSVLLPHNNFF